MTALGVALLFPIRSLGPRPGKGSRPHRSGPGCGWSTRTASWSAPKRSRWTASSPCSPRATPTRPTQPTLLIRPNRPVTPRPGREDWTPDGLVAYSKVCTHAGCPVGLYQAGEHLLLCPCHQSTFDVLDGARPVFGPATRSLPQLPLDGRRRRRSCVAQGDFTSPSGPASGTADR